MDAVLTPREVKDGIPKKESGYRVVVTGTGHKERSLPVDPDITMVHIQGPPYLWTVQMILAAYPNLKYLRVTPRAERRLGKPHQALCRERGVRIVVGYHDSSVSWREGENRSGHYQRDRNFLLNLQGGQKERFEELIKWGLPAALLTARYFCLKGEKFMPQYEVAVALDFPALHPVIISANVRAVFYYLDPTQPAAIKPRLIAKSLDTKVKRLRELAEAAKPAQELALKLGLEQLPQGLPPCRWEFFEQLIAVYRSPAFAELQKARPRFARVLVLRYGLEDGRYRVLREVAEAVGLTRERIRQMEMRGLKRVGITTE